MFQRYPKTKIISLISTVVVGLGSLFLYQNCAENKMGAVYQEASSSTSGVPFPYDATADEIAYMSCSDGGGTLDPRAYFTFKVGAYFQGDGLGLTSQFHQYISSMTSANQLAALTQNAYTNNVALQLDMRYRNALTQRATVSGLSTDGGDFAYFMEAKGTSSPATITAGDISLALLGLGNGQHLGMVSDANTGAPKRMEAELTLSTNEATMQAIRDQMTNTLALTMVYAADDGSGGSSTPPLSPVTLEQYNNQQSSSSSSSGSSSTGSTSPSPAPSPAPQTSANGYNIDQTLYGRGFNITFQQPSPSDFGGTGADGAGLPDRVLSSIQETNLDLMTNTGEPPRPWVCPTAFRYRIVRPQDAAAVGCQTYTDPPTVSGDLEFIRNVLPADQWYVDTTHRCIVPRNAAAGNCYDPSSTYVQYNINQPCGPNQTSACMQFLSICVRQ